MDYGWTGRSPLIQRSQLFNTSVPDTIDKRLATYLEFNHLLDDLAAIARTFTDNAPSRKEIRKLGLLMEEVSEQMWDYLENEMTQWRGVHTTFSQAIFTVIYTLIEGFERESSNKIKGFRIV